MKAQIIKEFGAAAVFQLSEIEPPAVKAGHMLVKVAASSVNPIDTKLRKMGSHMFFAPDLPAVLHGDVAGVVEAVGEGVAGFAPGDKVYGCAGGVKGSGGALAELMLVDAELMALAPKTLPLHEAAALPLVGITAWEALIDRLEIKAGETLLVQGGAGGVGHMAVQLAKARGAIVSATISGPEKAKIAARLGADHIINYHEQAPADYVQEITGGAGFDKVFDSVGGVALDHSFVAVKPGGAVASIATRAVHDLSELHSKSATLHVILMLLPLYYGEGRAHHGEILREIAALVDGHKICPLIDPRQFSLERVGAAHELLESGEAVGKVLVRICG